MNPIIHQDRSLPPRVAREYPFPITEISRAPDASHLTRAAKAVGADSMTAAAKLAARFKSIRSRKVKRFAKVFEGFTPFSILIGAYGERLVLKEDTLWHEPTQNGNVILIPCRPANLNVRSVEGFDFSKVPYALEFMNQFAGLSLDVIGSAIGILRPEHLRIAVDVDLGGLLEWHGSLPVFLPGNGDLLLMNQNGKAGMWEHESAPPKDCDPPVIDLSDFITDWNDPVDPTIGAVEDLDCDILEAVMEEIEDMFARSRRRR